MGKRAPSHEQSCDISPSSPPTWIQVGGDNNTKKSMQNSCMCIWIWHICMCMYKQWCIATIYTVFENMNICYPIWRTYIHRDQFLELMHFHFTIAVLSTIILSESWIDQQTTISFGGLIFRKCVSWTNIQHSSWVVRLGWGLPVWGKVQQVWTSFWMS